MASDIISKKTRNELREYFVGTCLREIEIEFDCADIDVDLSYFPNVTGERRTLVEQYYKTLDFSDSKDVKKFMVLYGNVLMSLEDKANKGGALGFNYKENLALFESLRKWIERDGFRYENGKVVADSNNVIIGTSVESLQKIDSDYITKQLQRINDSLDSDPSLAIGTAKELIESVSKTILDERKIEYSNKDNVSELVGSARKALNLLPDDIDESARGGKLIKGILSNLGGIAQNMAELRNLYGPGHGKSKKSRSGLSPRHARLAVGAASTLVIFLYETHLERND